MEKTIEDVKATLNRISSCREIVSIDLDRILKTSQIKICTARSCTEDRMKDAVEKLRNRFSFISEKYDRYTIVLLFSAQRALMMYEMNDFSNSLPILPFKKELLFGVAIDENLGNYMELILIATKCPITKCC